MNKNFNNANQQNKQNAAKKLKEMEEANQKKRDELKAKVTPGARSEAE